MNDRGSYIQEASKRVGGACLNSKRYSQIATEVGEAKGNIRPD